MREVIKLSNGKKIRISWWQVALLAIAVSAVSRLIASQSAKKSQEFYSVKLKQAPWSPPGWLFGPAWAFNNFFLLWTLLKIISMEKGIVRTSLLTMQAFIWTIFYSFDYVYFNKKSPVLAAIWTKSDAILALISFIISWKKDKEMANGYIPLAVWTAFASSVADYQVLHNSDPVFKTRPLLEYFKKPGH